MRTFLKAAALAAAILSAAIVPAFPFATSVAQLPSTTPLEPSQMLPTLNALINSMNTAFGWGTIGTCTGTTTATCQGTRVQVSVTGLTTAAAGTTSAAMTVTDASAASASTMILCSVNGYGGTGVPIVTTITPGVGSFSFTITNVAASGSLNATVVADCALFGT